MKDRPDIASPTSVAYYRWASGSIRSALDGFNHLYSAKPNPADGLDVMLLADEIGDTARRDEVLKDLCTKMRAQAPKSSAICDLMRESLATGKPLDLKKVDAILGSIPAEGQGNTNFLVGKFLINRGHAEAARGYIQKAADSPHTRDWARAMSIARVRQAGKVK